jgi:hypothetical protein
MPLTKRRKEQMFHPYAVEIGKLALEWNRLQEHLSFLFSVTLGTGNTVMLAYRIWHSAQSDRAQREMLRAAAEVMFGTELHGQASPKLLEDILWLLDQAQRLADRRNDAMHSPFILSYGASGGVTVAPAVFLGHPRAGKLQGKNVLMEFEWYRDCARVLADFAYELFYSLKMAPIAALPAPPLPERPRLPLLGQSKSRKMKHPRKRAK